MKKRYFIERRNSDDTYQIVYTSNNYDDCIAKLVSINSDFHHGVWCHEWVNTEFGYAPMAWIN